MFTGIIEELGKVIKIKNEGSNTRFFINASMRKELHVDQSVAHNGVCLTVENINDDSYEVVAINQTLDVTNLGSLSEGSLVNLERAMPANGRFEGHIVQGHVDGKAKCIQLEDKNGSTCFDFELSQPHNGLMVDKGSITLNGISLTVAHLDQHKFTVAIIPYTIENTMLKELKVGDEVNLEFDILAKHIKAMLKHTAS